jgi:hypothetical protein
MIKNIVLRYTWYICLVSAPPAPEFIDPEIAKTSPKRTFSMTENERFGLRAQDSNSFFRLEDFVIFSW